MREVFVIRALSTAPHPIVAAVRGFAAREVEPAATALEHPRISPHSRLRTVVLKEMKR